MRSSSEAPKTTARAAVATGIRILIVDDNRDIADVLARLLRRRGHDVQVAYDPFSALEAARAHRPRLALVDIGLPDMDGYELARRIRADEALGRIKLVAVSGYGAPADRQRASRAGFEEHVTKPFDFDHLTSLLDELVRKRAPRRSAPPQSRPPKARTRRTAPA